MSACIDISLPIPPIPPLPLFPAPNIQFPPAIPLGIPCCVITIPGNWISIDLAAVLGPLISDIKALNADIAVINAAIAEITSHLLVIPNCPMNGDTL
jgi:hypothetical protein